MLENLKKWLDLAKIAIDPQEHKELLTELRICTADEDMRLQNDQSNTLDLTDSFRLCLTYIR